MTLRMQIRLPLRKIRGRTFARPRRNQAPLLPISTCRWGPCESEDALSCPPSRMSARHEPGRGNSTGGGRRRYLGAGGVWLVWSTARRCEFPGISAGIETIEMAQSACSARIGALSRVKVFAVSRCRNRDRRNHRRDTHRQQQQHEGGKSATPGDCKNLDPG